MTSIFVWWLILPVWKARIDVEVVGQNCIFVLYMSGISQFFLILLSINSTYIQWNLDNSKSKGPNDFVWFIETLNNWGLKCIHIFKSGLQNEFWIFENFELLEFELSRFCCIQRHVNYELHEKSDYSRNLGLFL